MEMFPEMEKRAGTALLSVDLNTGSLPVDLLDIALEVSQQDATGLRALQGQLRLPDWD